MEQPSTKMTDTSDEISTQINKQAEVPLDYCGRRLDQVASELFSEFSRSRLQQWIKEGLLTVDDAKWLPKRKVLGGEQLTICASIVPEGEWVAEDIPLNIVFEDDHRLVLVTQDVIMLWQLPAMLRQDPVMLLYSDTDIIGWT